MDDVISKSLLNCFRDTFDWLNFNQGATSLENSDNGTFDWLNFNQGAKSSFVSKSFENDDNWILDASLWIQFDRLEFVINEDSK